MEKLPQDEISRIHRMLLYDETHRDRSKFSYLYDVITEHSAAPFSIWPIPNGDVRRIHLREISYDSLPFENHNEVEKGILFKDQRRYITIRHRDEILCEAENYETCRKEQCPLYESPGSEMGGQHGICREFKFAFRK